MGFSLGILSVWQINYNLLTDSWVGCLGHKYCMHASAGEGVCSLGSSLRQNSKLMYVLLQASPLCFSLADCCNRWLPCVQLSPRTEFLCWSADHVFDVRTPGRRELCVFAFLLCILHAHHSPAVSQWWSVWMHLTVFISLVFIATAYSLDRMKMSRVWISLWDIYKGIKKAQL